MLHGFFCDAIYAATVSRTEHVCLIFGEAPGHPHERRVREGLAKFCGTLFPAASDSPTKVNAP